MLNKNNKKTDSQVKEELKSNDTLIIIFRYAVLKLYVFLKSFSFQVEFTFIIHLLDLICVELFCSESLELHCVCQNSHFLECSGLNVEIFGLFKTMQPLLFANTYQFFTDQSSHLFISTYLFEGTCNFILLSYF